MRYALIYIFIGFSVFLSHSQSAFYDLGERYAKEGNYEEAIRVTKLAIDMDLNNYFNLISDYCALSEYFSYINNVDSCKTFSDKALKLCKEGDPENYKSVLKWLSHSLARVGLYAEAIEMRKEIFKLTKEKFGSESPLLVEELRLLSSFSIDAGDYKMAIEYAKNEEKLSYNIKDRIEKGYDKNNNKFSYDESFGWLRYVLHDYEEPKESIYYLLKILNDHVDCITEENRQHTLNTIWAISKDNDFIEGCLAVYKEETLHGTLNDKLANLINISVEDKNIKNDVHAPEYAQDLYNIVMNDNPSKYFNDEDIECLLFTLQDYYREIGMIRHSLEIGKKNIEWRLSHNLPPSYFDVCVLIFASKLDDEVKYAIELGNDILKRQSYDRDEDILKYVYECLSEAYLRIGDMENSKKYMAMVGEDDFRTLYAQASQMVSIGQLEPLLPIVIKLSRYKDISHENRDLIISWLMKAARNARKESILLSNIREYLDIYKNYILSNIPLMSEQELIEFFRGDIYHSYDLFYDFAIGIRDDTFEWVSSKEAYDYALLNKSILLTSQNEFRDLIKNSSDPSIIEKWNQFQQQDDTFSLHSEILKRDLIKYVSHHSNYLEQLSYTWEDIRQALKKDEVAIEFIKCFNFVDLEIGNLDPMYVALVIKPDINEPIPIVLGSSLLIDIINTRKRVAALDNIIYFQTFWSPLWPYINDAKTIFFSPSDQLNLIPIEYVKIRGDQRACDIWNLVRVTSTREIIKRNRINRKEQAVLFGGLKYDMDKESLVAESRSGNYHPLSTTRALTIESLRYGVQDLPESLTEVNNIANLFSGQPTLITGKSGTEESFKALVNSNYDIIHLATHGFFWNNENANKRDYVNFLNNSNFQELTEEENAMLRSGLVFSGANLGLMGVNLPDDVEDGVLTAKELSTMNLGNVDMVVMSACESGLGEISGEGVFGLQRGFKLAGANTLLMSLWKVDDKATCELMIEFYKHYLSGKSKQESLRLAQLKLRNSEEYSDPEYWAAFILLDALN